MLSRYLRTNLQFTRNYWAKKRVKSGVHHQLKAIDNDSDIAKDPGKLEELETDFMDVHLTHKDHEREVRRFGEQVQLWRTKQKYFKDDAPNFLTYVEKEQIKLLHSRDPEEWTPDKLSESFPATPEVIAKVIKAKWIIQNEAKVKKHDESVMKNWSLLKSGKLPTLSQRLREHLEKFANRSFKDLTSIPVEALRKPLELPKPSVNEFSSIIMSCKKYQDEEQKLQSQEVEYTTKKRNPFSDPLTDDSLNSDDNSYKQNDNLNREAYEKLTSKKRNPFSDPLTDDFLSSDNSYRQTESLKRESNERYTSNKRNPFSDPPTDDSFNSKEKLFKQSGSLNKEAKEDETFLLNKVTSKTMLRLQDLQSLTAETKRLPGDNPRKTNPFQEQPDETIEDSSYNPFSESSEKSDITVQTTEKESYPQIFGIEKYKSQEVTFSKNDSEKYSLSAVKERIHIPKKLYKQGQTYRIEDCYYDSDGQFLYRVPGMVN